MSLQSSLQWQKSKDDTKLVQIGKQECLWLANMKNRLVIGLIMPLLPLQFIGTYIYIYKDCCKRKIEIL